MMRWLYSLLIRWHPTRFRRQFGEEMLYIFDESVRQQSGFPLLTSAAISMLRQWLLRSEYWLRPESPVFAGAISTSQEFHRKSEHIQKKAKRINLVWALSVIPLHLVVSAVLQPTTQTVAAQAFYVVSPMIVFLSLYRLGRRFSEQANTFTLMQFPDQDPKSELARKRDSLRVWVEYMKAVLVLIVLIWAGPVLIALVFGGSHLERSWTFVNVIVFVIQALVFFIVLNGPNQRALGALQHEIESIDSGQLNPRA